MQNIRLEYAKKKDTPTLTAMYKELYPQSQKMKHYWSKVNPGKLRSGQTIIIAKSDTEIAGFLWFVWYEHIKHKGSGYIEELYVDRRFRRMGIGSRLVSEAIKIAKRKKMSVIFVTTEKKSGTAKKFYNSVGFNKMLDPWFVKGLDKK